MTAEGMKLSSEVDPIAGNALRLAALTEEQQQAGFPHDVVWPVNPE